jgi:hypothetical protein
LMDGRATYCTTKPADGAKVVSIKGATRAS